MAAQRAIELARLGEKWSAASRDVESSDNLAADDAKQHAESELYQSQHIAGVILTAARLLNKPAEADRIKASVESAPPAGDNMLSPYWLNRAACRPRGRKADALAFYQQALFTRKQAPQFYHGKLQDDVLYEASVVWKESG